MALPKASAHYLLAFTLFVSVVGSRLLFEKRSGNISGGSESSFVASRFDPRNMSALDRSQGLRESDRFRSRLYGNSSLFFWPGLKALQVSVTWLELLQGVHNESSYQGDFSWVFSKLDFIHRATPKQERVLLAALAPFYFLVNLDGAGASYLMNSLIGRSPDAWRVWFWSGYHAMENLKNLELAGDLYRHAALIPGSPTYLGALSYRLSNQEIFRRVPKPKDILPKDMPPSLVEKIKRTRPEW